VVLLAALLATVTACSSSPTDAQTPTSAGSSSRESSAPSREAATTTYAALGDSYSAAPLVPVTDVANGCFRSSNNYPALVAKSLGATLDDRTCGGARTKDFATSQLTGVAPQLSAVTAKTTLVTVGIGGNDENVFTTLVGQCTSLRAQDPTGSPCRASMTSTGQDKLLAALDRTQRNITAAVAAVKAKAPEAEILLVGYPHIIAATSTCSRLPLARGDYAYAEKVNRRLTEAVRGAARATGTTYVDVWGASKGHDICARVPWINGSVNDQRRAARYHPFAVEQQAVARLVLAQAGR
jgi:lysophospholipase L1-like esterase